MIVSHFLRSVFVSFLFKTASLFFYEALLSSASSEVALWSITGVVLVTREGFQGLCDKVGNDASHGCLALRVHVPKYDILWPQCTYIGTTLRPMHKLYEYMDP